MRSLFCVAFVSLLAAFASCQSSPSSTQPSTTTAPRASDDTADQSAAAFGSAVAPDPTTPEGHGVALFAGGCFWCMEPPFEKVDGVLSVTSGYTGGEERAPTYEQVSRGRTGHTEAVRVVYDPSVVTYDQLLDTFWRSHDPTDAEGQFADRGSQYRPGIFYLSEEQRLAAERSRKELAESGPFTRPIVVEITKGDVFWPAEEYHQDFYKKDPRHYQRYSKGSGRVDFLEKHWGEP